MILIDENTSLKGTIASKNSTACFIYTHTQPSISPPIHPHTAHVKISLRTGDVSFEIRKKQKMIPLLEVGGKRRRTVQKSHFLFQSQKTKTIGIFVVILFVLCMIVLNTSYFKEYGENVDVDGRKYDFKIRDDLPPWANKMILERDPECRNSVFATEIVIHEQIMRNSHGILTSKSGRPFFLRSRLRRLSGVQRFRTLREVQIYRKIGVGFCYEEAYWHRSGGRDHIWPWYMISSLSVLVTTTIGLLSRDAQLDLLSHLAI